MSAIRRFLPAVFSVFSVVAANCEPKETSRTTSFVMEFLNQSGASLDSSNQVEYVERGMTHIYKIDHPKPWYLKFTPQQQRSAGAFYPKRLWSPTTQASSLHGIGRRKALRPLINTINDLAGKYLLIPPHPLDQGGKIWELMTPGPEEMECPELANHLATGWLGIDAVPNPHHGDSPYLWDPRTYPASNLRELAIHLKEISDLSIKSIDEASRSALTHERDRYLQYDALIEPFLKAWGLSQFSLQEIIDQIEKPDSQVWKQLVSQAKKRMNQIDKRVAKIQETDDFYENASLEQLKKSFYKKNKQLFLQGTNQNELNHTRSELRFFHCVFVLEREGLVSDETRLLGRNLAQCVIAHQLADDILNKQGETTRALLKLVYDIRDYYKTVQSAPKSIQHGDAHPHEFLQDTKGNWILGGCESLHLGCVYGDIAQEYVRKLVRDYRREKPEQRDEILEKIQAVLIPDWFEPFWPKIMGYCVVDFAQELETLFLSYSMDPEIVDYLNLTITPETYLEQMNERLALDSYYRKEVFPIIKARQKREQK